MNTSQENLYIWKKWLMYSVVFKPVIHDHLHRLLGPSVPKSQIQPDGWNVSVGFGISVSLSLVWHRLSVVIKQYEVLHWEGSMWVHHIRVSNDIVELGNINFRMYGYITLEVCAESLCIHKATDTRGVSHEPNATLFLNDNRQQDTTTTPANCCFRKIIMYLFSQLIVAQETGDLTFNYLSLI